GRSPSAPAGTGAGVRPMIPRWLPILVALFWVGSTLILSEMRWFSRRPLDERLRPYVPGGWERTGRGGILSVGSFSEVISPLASMIGDTVSRLLGVDDDLDTRLRRVHSRETASTLRTRQLTWAVICLVGAAALVTTVAMPVALGVLFVLGAPALAFLLIEQSVSDASDRWRRRVFLELPIIAEQIGMLLS